MEGCDIPAHPRDYKENRTLGQLAMCLGNIRNLLGHKVAIMSISVLYHSTANHRRIQHTVLSWGMLLTAIIS